MMLVAMGEQNHPAGARHRGGGGGVAIGSMEGARGRFNTEARPPKNWVGSGVFRSGKDRLAAWNETRECPMHSGLDWRRGRDAH
jgi:hypothetical protein